MTAQLVRHIGCAHCVALFASSRTEPPTGGFRAWARDHGRTVLLPRILGPGVLEWCPDTGELREHPHYRVLEPVSPPVAGGLAQADVIIVPAAAVDVHGTRLGWGGGFYDRALAALPPGQRRRILALVHDDEVVAHLPRESHDIPVAAILTPVRYIEISPGRGENNSKSD